MNILVTGATGFIGRHLCHHLTTLGHKVTAAVRHRGTAPAGTIEKVMGELGPDTQWSGILDDIDTIVHLAGRAHVMNETSIDPLAQFRRVNTEGTRALARHAAGRCRRLVFVSSIKVNGETTTIERPFTALDAPRPQDAYGRSKAEAEDALFEIAAASGLEAVVVRPTLVHGPAVKGNLALLMKVIRMGLVLPLGSVDNRRSMIGLTNLCDLLATTATAPRAAGQIFLGRDGDDVSTSRLLRLLAHSMGRPQRLIRCPTGLLRHLAGLAGKRALASRLLDSLVVDDGNTRSLLDWMPPLSLEQGLDQMTGRSTPLIRQDQGLRP